MTTNTDAKRVEALLDAAADEVPALSALEAAADRIRAAHAALLELRGVPAADLVATLRNRASGAPS